MNTTKVGNAPFIRLYEQKDKDSMVHIVRHTRFPTSFFDQEQFRETAAPDLRAAGEPVLHYGSYIWCRPYLMLEPQYCFVIDDGDGRAVGYIIGTPDTANFVRKYSEAYIPYVLTEGIQPPRADELVSWSENLPNALRFIVHSPANLLHEEEPDLLRQYPAHLHIDLLPNYQRKGFGQKLIETFSERVKKEGAEGVHLVMAQANVQAKKFYIATGWRSYPKVLDNGVSGEEGVKDNTTWMIKKL